MRIIALMLIASLPFSLFAQKKAELSWPAMNLDPKTNLITYSEVSEVAGVPSADLYDRAMGWVKGYYKNYAEKLRKNDRDAGEIEIFGRFPIFAYDKKGVKTTSREGLIQYTLVIRFRDGRYKYTLNKLNLKDMSYQPLELWLDRDHHNARNHSFYMTDVDLELNEMLNKMKAAIAAPPDAGEDDW
ncbi:MAG: DUF4468 domain-containing protein [Flavobacteriales bacterium]|nr:DUF4468 domain-containing protein [Flavobacteriales bacterium]